MIKLEFKVEHGRLAKRIMTKALVKWNILPFATNGHMVF